MSTHDAEQQLKKAKDALAQAKGRGFKGHELEGYKRDVANATAVLKAVKNAFKASEKG